MTRKIKNPIFREEALLHLAKPDRSQPNPIMMPYFSWLMLAMVYTVIVTALFWGFFGSIPVVAEGQGLIVAHRGEIYNAVSVAKSGIMVKFLVKTGDHVRKNQPIAIIEQRSIKDDIAIQDNYYQKVLNEYMALKKLSDENIRKHTIEIANQNQQLENEIKINEDALIPTEDLLKTRLVALKKGIEVKANYVATYQSLQSLKALIEQGRIKLQGNKIEQIKYIDLWHERLRQLKSKVDYELKVLNNMRAKLQTLQMVESPVDGIVVALLKNLGDSVDVNNAIVSIATSSTGGFDALVFVPGTKGKYIKDNMSALVSPSTVKKTEYGSIKGIVETVSAYPVSEESIKATLHHEDLVRKFSESGPAFSVRIRLLEDKSTPSGLKWSSSVGPVQDITPGSIVTAQVIVEERSPFSLLIPMLKTLITP